MSDYVEVTSFELTVDNKPIDTVHNMMMLKIRLEYAGGVNGIFAGDKISVEIDNAANAIFNIAGIGGNPISINGDGDIGKVGTRTYRNDENGVFYLDVEFDDGYYNYYNGEMPDNIEGWLETTIFLTYKQWVEELTTTKMEVNINGVLLHKDVIAQPGGGPGPEPIDTPGPIIGKSGRYGDHSGNLGDLPETAENDYANFEPIRWSIQVGYQNLTWRDLRATNGEYYYTTSKSLSFSNANSTGERYNSEEEDYLKLYALKQGFPVNSPFHYLDCALKDYLVVGKIGSIISSAHEYVKKSLRIIRIMGREENNAWWGKDAFRIIVDSNFLKYAPEEPIDRYLSKLYFEGYRGLTVEEFLAQMHSEGQLTDAKTSDDILTFRYVDNGQAPGVADPDDTTQIQSFELRLGDLRFDGNTSRKINIVATDNSVVFENVAASNLPYAYLVYVDTNATEALLDHDFFNYNNSAVFKFNDETRSVISNSVWIKIEDDSGGRGTPTEVRIKKVDQNANLIQGIKFSLTRINSIAPDVRDAYTTINGTASFTLRAGEYTLTEEAPLGSGLTPVAPMSFKVTNVDEKFNLRKALEGTGYPDLDKIIYDGTNNIITNVRAVPPGPDEPCEVTASRTMDVCLPVTVKPYAKPGKETVKCCGEPIIEDGHTCTKKPVLDCNFTVKQKVCVELPVEFGAKVTSEDAGVECGKPSSDGAGCKNCGKRGEMR